MNKWVLLFVLAIIWGSSFILIKKSLGVFSAIEVGALRVAIAGLILVPFGLKAFRKIPKKILAWVFLAGLIGNFLPMFLFPIAELKVSSAMAGILNSLVPVFVVVLGYLFFKIKSKWRQVAGTIIGFFGAFLLISLGNEGVGEGHFWYASLIVLASAMYAVNGLIIKEYLTQIPSFQLSSAVFTIWFLPSIILLVFQGFFHHLTERENLLEGVIYVSILAVLGTALAMILFYKLIQQTSTVFAASVSYLMPIVAVIWGIIFNEPFNWWFVLGGALIFVGVYLIREKN